ncbi:hypothetical protein D3C73_1128480 [compost metagenome]
MIVDAHAARIVTSIGEVCRKRVTNVNHVRHSLTFVIVTTEDQIWTFEVVDVWTSWHHNTVTGDHEALEFKVSHPHCILQVFC